jgi:hypothetical protein
VNAVAIVLKAENLLAAKPHDESHRANPDLVLSLLEDGSCTEEDWLKDFWGGLLAMSCRVDEKDAASLIFVESFSKLTTYLCRISRQQSATSLPADSGLMDGPRTPRHQL